MDACNSVEREVLKVINKLTDWEKNKESQIDEALATIQSLKDNINKGDGPLNSLQIAMLNQTLASVNKTSSSLSSTHKDLHTSVSKIGKTVDRNFVSDFNSFTKEEIFEGSTKILELHQVILQHFYRQGRFDISDILSLEAGIPELNALKDPFMELNDILKSIKERQVQPVLTWAYNHRKDLRSASARFGMSMSFSKCPLELKLHQCRFIEMLLAGNRMGAIAYARSYFPYFVKKHEKKVQNLMGALMYTDLYDSPYKHLLSSGIWDEIAQDFVKEACALMGLSVQCPLGVVINAGCRALPALLNIEQVMVQREVSGSLWNTKEELPIEIDLGSDCRFHSVFACPILRQQSSDQNPPLRLTCGHCISKDALKQLSTGVKMKCPLCPVEQNPNDARQITF